MDYCEHIAAIVPVVPSADGCEGCLKTGDIWVHLRLCESCGYVGCCDISINRHATKHYQASHHPIISSQEPSEDWGYSYVDDLFFESLPKV
ncbi:MAG: UBP-type zinc finger domain-containing protein [Pyrinomonadaceae bacterium]